MSTTETEVVGAQPLVTEERVRELMAESKNERLKAQVANGIVNPIVLADFLDIRPQMVYNYIRTEKIKARREEITQHIVIDLDEAVRYAQKYLNRQAEKAAKIQAELAGTKA